MSLLCAGEVGVAPELLAPAKPMVVALIKRRRTSPKATQSIATGKKHTNTDITSTRSPDDDDRDGNGSTDDDGCSDDHGDDPCLRLERPRRCRQQATRAELGHHCCSVGLVGTRAILKQPAIYSSGDWGRLLAVPRVQGARPQQHDGGLTVTREKSSTLWNRPRDRRPRRSDALGRSVRT